MHECCIGLEPIEIQRPVGRYDHTGRVARKNIAADLGRARCRPGTPVSLVRVIDDLGDRCVRQTEHVDDGTLRVVGDGAHLINDDVAALGEKTPKYKSDLAMRPSVHPVVHAVLAERKPDAADVQQGNSRDTR